MNQQNNELQIIQRAFVHIVIRRRSASTTTSVSINSRRHHAPTAPTISMTVEHRPMSPLLVRLVSQRPTSRPIILDSFNDNSSFRYAFVTRGPRLEYQYGRLRRANIPQLSFSIQQFTSEVGTTMMGLDIVYTRMCPVRQQPQMDTVETDDAIQGRNSGTSVQQDSRLNRSSYSAPPSISVSMRPATPVTPVSSSEESSVTSSRVPTPEPEDQSQGDLVQPEQ